jgi:serine/threonine protein kinase
MQALEFRTAFGRYVAEDKLGEGGSGIVYSASDEDNQKVAIKVLHPSKATRARTKRFKNEYLFGFQNSHPQLVRVLDIGTVEQAKGISAPFYVMPRYSGSLRTLMKTGVDHSQVLSLFARLWAGIEAANLLRVVHRDLKPENVLANNLTDVVISDSPASKRRISTPLWRRTMVSAWQTSSTPPRNRSVGERQSISEPIFLRLA